MDKWWQFTNLKSDHLQMIACILSVISSDVAAKPSYFIQNMLYTVYIVYIKIIHKYTCVQLQLQIHACDFALFVLYTYTVCHVHVLV